MLIALSLLIFCTYSSFFAMPPHWLVLMLIPFHLLSVSYHFHSFVTFFQFLFSFSLPYYLLRCLFSSLVVFFTFCFLDSELCSFAPNKLRCIRDARRELFAHYALHSMCSMICLSITTNSACYVYYFYCNYGSCNAIVQSLSLSLYFSIPLFFFF